MRVLDVHADHCSFETVAAPPAEDAPDPEPPTPDPDADDADAAGDGAVPVPEEGGFDDCLAAFVAVEGDDAGRTRAVAAEAAAHLADRADELRLSRVLVYPCPALSERGADRETAVEACRALGRALGERDALDVLRAPVGWHHALALETAGHPFAESVNRFTGRPGVEEVDSEWTVLVDGERRDAAAALPDLEASTRAAFEWAMDGPTPDPLRARGDRDAPQPALAEPDGLGGRRLLPAGRLVHDLLADRVQERLLAFGAAPIETAVTYDLSDPDTARLLGAVAPHEERGDGQRLRPSARLGALAVLRDADLSRADCPLLLAETGPAQRGDGAATVSMLHAATADRDAAWDHLQAVARLVTELAADCGLDAAPVCYAGGAVRPERLDALAAALDRPVLVHRDRRATTSDDASARVEFHDERRDPGDVPHVRLDPDLAARAGVAFGAGAESEADRTHPVLVDCEPVGSLDAVRRACWADPPAWLAPTQVRFVTVEAAHRDRAVALAEAVADAGLRADVDDRPRPVGERLDRAERDRVPFVAVVGDREADDGDLTLWDRREGGERSLPAAALTDIVGEAVEGYPQRDRYLPLFVDDGPLRGAWGEKD
jgi:threonyl-tRNA synthetase